MRFRALVTLLTVAATVFALSACGSGGPAPATPSSTNSMVNVIAPSITIQPAAQSVSAGQQATFTVAATGTAPLTYQWYRNGAAIGGATSSSYTTPATTTSDNGAQFTVVVTNSAASITSNSAALTVSSIATSSTLHYTPNANFDSNGNYLPGADGFNLADVSDVSTLNSLPTGVLGLVWIGLCNGADATFTAAIQPYIGNAKLYGFYLMDEPDPTGQYAPLCPAANLLAESNWIHANVPGARTFIVMMNMGSPTNPSYTNTYSPGNTNIDLFGLDPYPVRPQFTGGVDYSVINAGVAAAEAAGIPLASIVPVYQAFGGGGYASWSLPTPDQETQLLATWESLVPSPAFDYAYSWGTQNGDQALSTTPDLQPIFLQHNTGP